MYNTEEASLFRSTLTQIKKGFYLDENDNRVPIKCLIKLRYGSELFDSTVDISKVENKNRATNFINHAGEDLLEILRSLTGAVFLCSVSSLNPGGGAKIGRRGLEEFIVSRSSLYQSLSSFSNYYIVTDLRHKSATGYPLKDNQGIFSPSVCFWKDTEGKLLKKPFLTNIISIPPILVPDDKIDENGKVESGILKRIERKIKLFMTIAIKCGYEKLIIPRFGCGSTYKNNYDQLLSIIEKLVSSEFKGRFSEIHLV